ncbi:hypothetical protein Y032_0002g987 [Ancylostoma ceylanicum]|uniref:Uncharacterized protein n=1 Tax=Ancylostoma ceylanicum TaxID=53326 RepID=A0A016W446_9BILA|nr:hypothetical protein Y032_0002g987 [Ancylostoma ceylanicum]
MPKGILQCAEHDYNSRVRRDTISLQEKVRTGDRIEMGESAQKRVLRHCGKRRVYSERRWRCAVRGYEKHATRVEHCTC